MDEDRGVITGISGAGEARLLSRIIREGRMAVDLKLAGTNVIPPEYGQKVFASCIYSILLIMLMLAVFLTAIYKQTGVMSSLVIFIKMLWMIIALSLVNFTLNIQGFTGLIVIILFYGRYELTVNGITKERIIYGIPGTGAGKKYKTLLYVNAAMLIVSLCIILSGFKTFKSFGDIILIGTVLNVLFGIAGNILCRNKF